MMLLMIILGVLIMGIFIFRLQRIYDANDSYSAREHKSSEPATVKKYSEPGEIAEPLTERRTFIKVVSPGLSLYKVEKTFADLLPFHTRQFHYYKIKGKNINTGYFKTIRVTAYDEPNATNRAFLKGLLPPYEIEICDELPTQKQKQFIKDLGMTVNPDFSKEDASCIISRTYDQEPAAEQWLLNFAFENDIPFSRYATNGNILRHICKEYFIDSIHEIAFWVYCVDKFLNAAVKFNNAKYIAIAQQLNNDNEFMRLYDKACKEDNINYLKPNTRIKAFKIVKQILI